VSLYGLAAVILVAYYADDNTEKKGDTAKLEAAPCCPVELHKTRHLQFDERSAGPAQWPYRPEDASAQLWEKHTLICNPKSDPLFCKWRPRVRRGERQTTRRRRPGGLSPTAHRDLLHHLRPKARRFKATGTNVHGQEADDGTEWAGNRLAHEE
jgi:hypothetical protein